VFRQTATEALVAEGQHHNRRAFDDRGCSPATSPDDGSTVLGFEKTNASKLRCPVQRHHPRDIFGEDCNRPFEWSAASPSPITPAARAECLHKPGREPIGPRFRTPDRQCGLPIRPNHQIGIILTGRSTGNVVPGSSHNTAAHWYALAHLFIAFANPVSSSPPFRQSVRMSRRRNPVFCEQCVVPSVDNSYSLPI